MSYDVSLCDPHTGQRFAVTRHNEGGTYAIDGTNEAELNITYNYGMYFAIALGYIGDPAVHNLHDFLNGKSARDVIPALAQAVSALGTLCDRDYWAATPGNAGHALSILLNWAKQYPDGVFEVN